MTRNESVDFHKVAMAVSSRASARFNIIGMAKDDVFQQAYLLCMEGYPRHNPDHGSTLEAFLWVHTKNRLLNLCRDTVGTPGSKRRTLNTPINLAVVSMDGESSMLVSDRDLSHDREIVGELDEIIPWDLREFYIKLKYGCKISTFYKYKVINFIMEVRATMRAAYCGGDVGFVEPDIMADDP